MTPDTSILTKVLNVKGMHIDGYEYRVGKRSKYGDKWEFEKICVHVRPYKRLRCLCPKCMIRCSRYDTSQETESSWRGPNLNGYYVEVLYQPCRVKCPKHGVITEYVPWQDGNSRCLPDFNNEVTYLTLTCPKSVVAEYMAINWRTVGNCIIAAHHRLEMDPNARLRNLRRICVDETSYKKGHKYMTVVYDLDRNRVVWLREGHGVEVFSEFCELLTEEERANITVIAGDGAKWIDVCKEKYFPNAERCIDKFHVIGWVNESLDKTRKSVVAKAEREYNRTKEEIDREIEAQKRAEEAAEEGYISAKRELAAMTGKRGRPSRRKMELQAKVEAYEAEFGKKQFEDGSKEKKPYTGEQLSILDALKERKTQVKGVKYTLLMNQEDLQSQNQTRIDLLAASYPDLYKGYQLKESIRLILRLKDPYLAEKELTAWIMNARNSGLRYFRELADKIERHMGNIIRSIKCGANSSKSEATNTTIKSLIKTARGFANLEHLFSLIMLRCSDLVIPLNNRFRPTREQIRRRRESAYMCKDFQFIFHRGGA